MHPPPSHVKSKSALLAASSSGGISLSCFEGKYIASVLDLLPLDEGVALVPTCIRRRNRWKWRCRRLIPLIKGVSRNRHVGNNCSKFTTSSSVRYQKYFIIMGGGHLMKTLNRTTRPRLYRHIFGSRFTAAVIVFIMIT